jgi:ubiquinone/menaquinone biosynthesis C-methylase UbiE
VQTLFRRLLFHYWYFRHPPWDTGISPPELNDFLNEHQPGRAIDLGCGTGTNVVTLARAGWQVTGVDFAARAIQLARKKVRQARVQAELSVQDVTRLDGIAGPFDLAFDLGCFHTLPQAGKSQYLEQLDRILAPQGFWLLYGFLKPEASGTGPGLSEADIGRITSQVTLLSRQDGTDQKGARASAWFLFQKQ